MKTLNFLILFCAFCTLAPFSCLLTGCGKVEAQSIISIDSVAYADDFEDYIQVIDSKFYMFTTSGQVQMKESKNIHKLYSYFTQIGEEPFIYMREILNEEYVIMKVGNDYYYQLSNPCIYGWYLSESDFPIYKFNKQPFGEPHLIQLDNISESLRDKVQNLIELECFISQVSTIKFRLIFGGWNSSTHQYDWYETYIIQT